MLQNQIKHKNFGQIKDFLLGLNIQSLRCHHDELVVELDSFLHKPKIIALTETWLTNSDTQNMKIAGKILDYSIASYHPIHSKPRKNYKKRGGVAFYVHETLKYSPIEYDTDIECAIIEVDFGHSVLVNFCVVYRPQANKLSAFFPEFELLLQFVRSLKHDTIIFGDFNIDTIKESADKIKYENLLLAYNFRRQNSEPTRVTPTTSTCLDHYITSFQATHKTEKTTMSDHYTVLGEIPEVEIDATTANQSNIFTRNLRNIKGDNTLKFLFLLEQKLLKLDANNMNFTEEISRCILECIDRFAPEKEMKTKENRSDWITNTVKNAITKRDRLFQKWTRSPTEENLIKYRKQRNLVTSLIRNAKRDCNYKKLGPNPTSKTIYRNLKYQLSKNQKQPEIPDIEKLNEFFATIGSVLSKKVEPHDEIVRVPNFDKTMFLSCTDEKEVAKLIQNLKNKKSIGHDGISNEMLKCCSPIIEKYIVKAFNRCIDLKKFPNFLKVAKVVPVFKKGERDNPENYRPISLLTSISKLFEKLLYSRMVNFFNTNKLFSPMQFGFRAKHSCVHAIVSITDYMRDEIDKRNSGQACFLDLKKAFDSLDHTVLMNKLYSYGFRGPTHELIEDYLSNRWQFVEVNRKKTERQPIKTGVPQGSILGPFLFLVYINDLAIYAQNNNKIAIFADDTSILKSGKKLDTSLQADLDKISNWFSYNKLSLNTSKCEVMNFGCRNSNKLTLLRKELPKKESFKYLGVNLDSKLTYRDHIEHVSKKLNKFSGMIYKVRDMYPVKCLLNFYSSFAKSVITYGLLVYGSAAKTNLEKIENAQRRILRAIFYKNKYESLGQIFEKNCILTVFELYVMELFREVFKQLKSESPLFSLDRIDVCHYNTRRKEKGLLPLTFCRTVTRAKSVDNRLRKAYNWLKDHDLIPVDLPKMSSAQTQAHLKKISDLYVRGSCLHENLF